MSRRRNKIYQLTIQEDPEAFPMEWNQVPDEILQNAPGELIYDLIMYSRKTESFILRSVLYFKEIERSSEESFKVDNKKGIIFEIK